MVLTLRDDEMKHLGDVCKINGAEIEKVDVITFGAPCRDDEDVGIEGDRMHMR